MWARAEKFTALICLSLMLLISKTGASETGASEAGAYEAGKPAAEGAPKLGVQLWSVKDDLESDFEGTLRKLAAMGFEGVEFAQEFGPYKHDPLGLKRLLKDLQLEPSGAHISFNQLKAESFGRTVSFYQALGVSALIIGWDERAWHPQRVKAVVADLNRLAIRLKPHGMFIGYHNHLHELDLYQGSTYWDYIASNTHQDVVMQLDVGWAVHAGKDPVSYVKRYPGRTWSTHFKVRLPDGIDESLPIIGRDRTDWLKLSRTTAEVGETRWIIVEQEQDVDGMTRLEVINESMRGLSQILSHL